MGVGDDLRFVHGHERSVHAVECVDIAHHAVGAMHHGEVVPEEFLGEAANGVKGSFIRENFLDRVAIAEPVERGTPEEPATLSHAPSAGHSFAGERVEVRLTDSTAAGAEANGPESGTRHECVEHVGAAVREDTDGVAGSSVISGLHENVGHAAAGPIGFEKNGKMLAKSGEARVAHNGEFERFEGGNGVGGPGEKRDSLAVVTAGEFAEDGDALFEEGNVSVVKAEKPDERAKGVAE